MSQDILDLLLPDVNTRELDRARRMTTALRLCTHAGRAVRAEPAVGSMECARPELEVLLREHRVQALASLIRHHLEAHLGLGAFLLWGQRPQAETEDQARSAWCEVLEAGENCILPVPGEAPLAAARRLGEHLSRLDPRAETTQIWLARLQAAEEGPKAGECAWRALLAGERPSFRLRRAAVAGVVACLMSRGRVGAARDWLTEHLELAAADEELAWYLVWCELALGEVQAARGTARGLEPYSGILPHPLAQLRLRRREWVDLLPGREPPAGGVPGEPPGREDVGASLLAVFVLGAGHEASLLDLEVEPSRRADAEAWARSRTQAVHDPGTPEQSLVLRAQGRVADRREAPLVGVFDPGTRVQVLWPIRFEQGDLEGEVAGWVAVELPHHLAPDPHRIEALTDRSRRRVLALAGSPRVVAAGVAIEPSAVAPDHDPRSVTARRMLAGLGMKTARRRWWFFDVCGDDVELVAEGGGALADRQARPGLGRAVGRARAAGGTVHFEAPDPRLALHAASASGMVVPLRGPRGVVGLLAVESIRRRDFREVDRLRLGDTLAASRRAWAGARFAAWHLRKFREEIHVDVQACLPLDPEEAIAAGRSRMPASVVGPRGVGRRVAARWLHFEGGSDRKLRQIYMSDRVRERPLPVGEGTCILHHLEGSDPGRQARVLQRLDERDARLVVILGRHPAQAVRRGDLIPELGARLGRLVLRLSPLRERRAAIPGLVTALAQRIAREEGLATPSFSDEAHAILWRQPWPENVRGLEALVARVVLLFPGEEVFASEVRLAAERMGLRLLPRIPSRRPTEGDLRAALRVTCCLSGATNKTRAAAYLGWDPDTLVLRLREARIHPDRAPRLQE